MTCEPYTRNRSAGRLTASEALRTPRSVGSRGWGCEARRAPQQPTGGGSGGRGRAGPGGALPRARARAPSARPHPAPCLALHSRTLLLPWGPTRPSAGLCLTAGDREPSRPSVNRSPAQVYGSPALCQQKPRLLQVSKWPRPLPVIAPPATGRSLVFTQVNAEGTRPSVSCGPAL